MYAEDDEINDGKPPRTKETYQRRLFDMKKKSEKAEFREAEDRRREKLVPWV